METVLVASVSRLKSEDCPGRVWVQDYRLY